MSKQHDDRDMIALMASIIWSQNRGNLLPRDDADDLDEIREAIKFANDCLVETEHFIEDEQEEQTMEVLPPRRRNAR